MEAFFLLKKFEIYKVSHKNIIMKMNFENWYNKMLVENETAVKAEITTANVDHSITSTVSSREDIISDVDSIMTQLDQLSAQVKEDYREIELEWGFEPLDENLVLEGAWDDAKSSYGSLFGDPVFQLVGLGIAGVLGAIGLSVKAIKDTKRNNAIAKQVLGDYEKLKKQKLDELHQEAIIQNLEIERDQIGAEENESFTNVQEADPATTKKPIAKKPVAKKPDAPKVAVDADAKDAQIKKMKARMTAQIDALKKKKDVMSAGVQKLEEFLDKKYKSTDADGNSKITGFGSKKVHTLVAQAEDDVQITVDEMRLKLFGGEMDPEMKKKVAQRVNKLKRQSAQRSAAIEKEAEENAKKAKEIAAKDEETKNALAELEKNKGKKDTEQTTDGDSTSTSTDDKPTTTEKPAGQSDAEKAAATQQDKDAKNAADAEKYAAQRAEADKKKKDKEKEAQDSADKDSKKNTKDGMIDRYMKLLKKADEAGDEKKYREIKDKIAALQKAESWQLEGTELGRLFEMELLKMEAEFKLFESKNTAISVADKFRMLLG